jgi:hypothetical protein
MPISADVHYEVLYVTYMGLPFLPSWDRWMHTLLNNDNNLAMVASNSFPYLDFVDHLNECILEGHSMTALIVVAYARASNVEADAFTDLIDLIAAHPPEDYFDEIHDLIRDAIQAQLNTKTTKLDRFPVNTLIWACAERCGLELASSVFGSFAAPPEEDRETLYKEVLAASEEDLRLGSERYKRQEEGEGRKTIMEMLAFATTFYGAESGSGAPAAIVEGGGL